MKPVMPIQFTEIPAIPSNLTNDNLHLLIPVGFEELVSYEIKLNSLELTFKNADTEGSIVIPSSIYSPDAAKTYFPKFLLELTSLAKPNDKLDYFGKHSNCLINQNQLLYWILQHRLSVFSRVNKQFSALLNRDVKALREYIGYSKPNSYNAIKKVENTWAILSVFNPRSLFSNPELKQVYSSQCIGDILSSGLSKPRTETLRLIAAQLPIHPSSESSLSKKGKFVVYPYDQGPIYRSVGYKHNYNPTGLSSYDSIFPPKQNVPARLKTHLFSDAYELVTPAKSVFMQDNIPDQVNRCFISKDNCLSKAVIVFHKMNLNNNRFVCGEVEASDSFVNQDVWKSESVTEQFDKILVEEGHEYFAKPFENKILLGYTLSDQPVFAQGTTHIKILNRQALSGLGAEKIKFNKIIKCGNARLDSNTGLKGVTKAKPNLGLITFDSLNKSFKPDLVVGMNAVKAGHNTIALAQAAFAVELGLYTPKSTLGYLNTWDEEEINKAAASLPSFTYVDEFGETQEVYCGLIYPRFTELCQIYGTLGDQSFMFTTGKMLKQAGAEELYEHLWDQYVKPEYKSAVLELQKILDDRGNSFPEDNLPRFTAKSLYKPSTYTRKDLITRKNDVICVDSKLLDPEVNKGFYIDLSANGGPIIRCPSANLLNLFVSQLPDKTWIYPSLAIIISNILNNCMADENGQTRLGYIFDKNSKSDRYTDYKRYMNEVKTTLYSGEDSAMMMIQRLTKPELFGFSMKQVVDALLPPNTVCLLDEQKTDEICEYVYGKENASLGYLMHGLIPIHMRHPSLWTKQLHLPRFWTREDFSLHLMNNYGFSIDDYLTSSNNKDVIIISPDIALNARADVDKLYN